ncbi:uncharacterized protein LOC131681444 isoform X2 [Topomyia yanbarensis]|uniref:uncharacterized protein LOC131681444 isoform X2 n=1 Tax=Topomyia yanbarensis TaxID=2498891 RepID=UPI00273BD108|nr:uncharacterized protein LOC131681444 isoform X2 [Topomyia yanbarensis]
MNKLFIVVCLVLFTTGWLSEAKPQGCPSCGSPHEEVSEKCCNNCDLCRASFEVEKPLGPICPRFKHHSYNVEHIRTPCRDEVRKRHDADIEIPLDPDCLRLTKTYYKVNRPPPLPCPDPLEELDFEVQSPTVEQKCKELKLTASVDYDPRHCQCDCSRN